MDKMDGLNYSACIEKCLEDTINSMLKHREERQKNLKNLFIYQKDKQLGLKLNYGQSLADIFLDFTLSEIILDIDLKTLIFLITGKWPEELPEAINIKED